MPVRENSEAIIVCTENERKPSNQDSGNTNKGVLVAYTTKNEIQPTNQISNAERPLQIIHMEAIDCSYYFCPFAKIQKTNLYGKASNQDSGNTKKGGTRAYTTKNKHEINKPNSLHQEQQRKATVTVTGRVDMRQSIIDLFFFSSK